MPTLSQASKWFHTTKTVFDVCAISLILSRPVLNALGIKTSSLDLMFKTLQGYWIGHKISNVFIDTGIELAVHEYLGHATLGCLMIYRYISQANGPICYLPDIKRFERILNSTTLTEGYKNLESWLFGDRLGGSTTFGTPDGETKFGALLGPEGRDAWLSITGSLPTVILNACSVKVGMSLKNKQPRLGWSLISFGLITNLRLCHYALQAVGDPSYPPSGDINMHDFIQFSKAMSHITGLKDSTIATATAVFMTAYIPLLTLYLYRKTNKASLPNEKPANVTENNQQRSGLTFFSDQVPVPAYDPNFETILQNRRR